MLSMRISIALLRTELNALHALMPHRGVLHVCDRR